MEDRDAYHRRIKQQTAKCAATPHSHHRPTPTFLCHHASSHPLITNHFKTAQVRSHVAVKCSLVCRCRLHPLRLCLHKWQQRFSRVPHSKGGHIFDSIYLHMSQKLAWIREQRSWPKLARFRIIFTTSACRPRVLPATASPYLLHLPPHQTSSFGRTFCCCCPSL